MANPGARAWSLLTIEGSRQWGGNTGYPDELGHSYSYDNNVPNSRRMGEGDLVFLRDRDRVLGAAIIEEITEEAGMKLTLRCPACGIAGIKERVRLSPAWKCRRGHEFDSPVEKVVGVTKFQAFYDQNFVSAPQGIPSARLKECAPRPVDQLSIEELDPERAYQTLSGAFPDCIDLFARSRGALPLSADDGDHETRDPEQGGESRERYAPSLNDLRKKAIRAILVRRGQRKFRRNLRERYGDRCLVTGCELPDLLEAAHIHPYRGDNDNHVDNGLLLRADIHTLFDLDLLGIEPGTLRVYLAPEARLPGYSELEGRVLAVSTDSLPSGKALAKRWSMFRRKTGR